MTKGPKRVVVDASFLIRAWDPKNATPEAPKCREVWRQLIESRIEIVIPTVVVAELQARDSKIPTPRMAGVIIAPFDEECVEKIRRAGGTMTFADGRPKGYWKYDTLIGACVAAVQPAILVHVDGDFQKIAGQFGFMEKRYDELASWIQMQLPLE
jgi:predicted nucleic acid-binding protein